MSEKEEPVIDLDELTDEQLEVLLAKRQSDFVQALSRTESNSGAKKFTLKSQQVICIISDFLSHNECLLQMAPACKFFYLALQLKYKKLCTEN